MRSTQPSALPADYAERVSDDEHLFAYRPRNRLVIDLEAHRGAVAKRDRKIEAMRRGIEECIKILKESQ